MKKEIIINASKDRSRIAIVEDGELVELYVENPENVRTIGNIYLGRVQKVMPAIQAAFVDVGLKQDAFLHFSDLTDNAPQLFRLAGENVPGLEDAPALALAPRKRVADDDAEPDVEETLEVEPDGEDEEKTETPPAPRGRRSSRRGRGRRRRAEEEEEEEEEGEERRRYNKYTIDLTRKTGRIEPTAPPRPSAAPEPPRVALPEAAASDASTPEAPTAGASASEAVAPEAPSKPTRSRRARATRTEAAPAEAATTDAVATEAVSAEAVSAEAPKRGRKRRAKAETAPRAPAEAEALPDDLVSAGIGESEATAPVGAAAEADEKPRRSRRARARKADEALSGATTDASETDASETDASAAPAAAERDADEKPPRRRRGRKAEPASVTDGAAEEAKASGAAFSAAASSAAAAAEATDEPVAGDAVPVEPRLAAPEAEGSAPEAGDAEAGDAEAGDAEADASVADGAEAAEARPRRRRRRGGRGRRSRAAAAEASPSDAEGGEVVSPEGARPEGVSPGAVHAPAAGPSAEATGRGRQDTEASGEASAEASGAEAPASRRRRGRRGRGGAEPVAEGGSEASGTTPAPAEDAETPDAGPSRRTRRGRAADEPSPEGTSENRNGTASPKVASPKADAPTADGAQDDAEGKTREAARRGGRSLSPHELLRHGGRVLVKITKEPISTKGSRVSTDISLAGRFLVLVPAADYVAVSKKIESARERRRLRTLANSLRPEGFGVIVRTVAENRDAKSLDTDLRLLIEKWRKIEKKLAERPTPPVLLYEDVSMVSSIVRDLFTEDYDRILVDDPKVYKNVRAYVQAVAPHMADRVKLHDKPTPLFRSVGIEKAVEEAFSKRVNMKSGGYLYIETTEAMHVIDVNSGRAGRGKSQAENLLDVNLEAAREVAKQLRLRDLGGIIVVDFIDMKSEADRRKLYNTLKECFARDRAVTKLLPMSDFGLVEITRQRLRPSITTARDEADLDPAEAARLAGAGEIPQPERRGRRAPEPAEDPASVSEQLARVLEQPAPRERGPREPVTPEALTEQLRRWIEHYRNTVAERYAKRPIVIRVHPLFGAVLKRGLLSPLMRWRLKYGAVPFQVEEDPAQDPLTFDVRDVKSGRSLLAKYTPD